MKSRKAMSFAGFLSFNNYLHITADMLRWQTGFMCNINSAYALCYMLQSDSVLKNFENFALLTDHTSISKLGFANHTYFVLKGRSGRYYAGSPANYSENAKDKELFLDVIVENSLGDLFNSIKEKVGGTWRISNEENILNMSKNMTVEQLQCEGMDCIRLHCLELIMFDNYNKYNTYCTLPYHLPRDNRLLEILNIIE